MRMINSDYQAVKDALRSALSARSVTISQWDKHYEINNMSETRARWDLLQCACDDHRIETGTGLIGSKGTRPTLALYDYLNDKHIDTALRSIFKDLRATFKCDIGGMIIDVKNVEGTA